MRIKVCDASVGSSDRLSSSVQQKLTGASADFLKCPPSGKLMVAVVVTRARTQTFTWLHSSRSAYDFGQIRASRMVGEVLTVYNTSSSGRYYLAVYANYKADFLVEAKLTAPPARSTGY